MPIAANTKMCSFQLSHFLTFCFSSLSTTSMHLSSLFHTSSSFISISPLHVISVSLLSPFLPIISPQHPSLFSSPITGPSLLCLPFSASHFTCPLSESELPLLTRIVYKVLLSIPLYPIIQSIGLRLFVLSRSIISSSSAFVLVALLLQIYESFCR